MKRSIRLRLVAAFAVTLCLVLVGVGFFVVTQFRSQRDATINAELRSRTKALVATTPKSAPPSFVNLLGTSDEQFGQILDASGHVVATSRSLRDQPLVAASASGLQTVFVRTKVERRHARVLIARAGDRTFVVVTALDDRDDAIHKLDTLLWFGGALSLAAASLLAWVLAGAALRPVEKMRAQAATYTTGNLSGRLNVPSAGDELHRLAETLNSMLERIQGHVNEQRTFIDNASHELRTPLANLTMELELALRHERSASELRAALESATQETHRLNRLASDLLLLSRASDAEASLDRQPTDLAALTRETTATFRARAAAQNVALIDDLEDIEPISVNPSSIRRALTNLLDNALRATPTGGTITTTLTATPTTVKLAVHDTGRGFPPQMRSHAFDLFARGNGPRRPGAGLGLGIVAAVAAAHGGHAAIEDHATQTVVSITLPGDRTAA